MLVFIPVADYSTSAASAASIESLDFGFVKGGETKTLAFRIGNRGSSSASITLSVSDPFDPHASDRFTITPDALDIDPDEISDTVSITLTLPLDVATGGHVLDLLASTGERLEITYDAVGAASARRPQFPDRSGRATPISSSPILALGDTLLLRRFDPIALPDDRTVYVERGARNLANDGGIRFRSTCDPCERLAASNDVWGYSESRETIVAQFSRESRQTRSHFLADGTEMSFTVSASLILPAEFELTREWALFAPESQADRAQWKRTVYLIQRLGELWAIENVRTMEFSADLSHFECELVALHDRAMGSPDFWNPFALTYEFESDKPYAAYVCDISLPVTTGADASNASNPSNPSAVYNPSAAPPAPESETAPVPVAAWYFDANRMLIVEFDKPLQTLENGTGNGNWTFCDGTNLRQQFTIRPNAIESVVSMVYSSSVLLGCSTNGEVTYLATTPDIVGANGVAVAPFTFPATVI